MPTSSYKFENCVCTKVYLLVVDRKRERKLPLALWTKEFPFLSVRKKGNYLPFESYLDLMNVKFQPEIIAFVLFSKLMEYITSTSYLANNYSVGN